MKKFTHERHPAYIEAWQKIAWFKEYPHLTRISCDYLNNNFSYYFDTQKKDVGVLQLVFEDGNFVITSSKTSLRKRISEIVSNAVSFNKDKRRGPIEVKVGVRLYQNQKIKVYLLSEEPTMKKKIVEEFKDA